MEELKKLWQSGMRLKKMVRHPKNPYSKEATVKFFKSMCRKIGYSSSIPKEEMPRYKEPDPSTWSQDYKDWTGITGAGAVLKNQLKRVNYDLF